jgi:hypothetical protein
MRRILNQAANATVQHKGSTFDIVYRPTGDGRPAIGHGVEQTSAELLESLVVNHAAIAVGTPVGPTLVP